MKLSPRRVLVAFSLAALALGGPSRAQTQAAGSYDVAAAGRKIAADAHDLLESPDRDRCLKFSSPQEEAAFRRKRLETQKGIRTELARHTADGNLNAIGMLQGYVLDAMTYEDRDCRNGKSTAQQGGANPPARADSLRPDTGEAEAAIDRKFALWSSGWSMDRYQRGSTHIAKMDCEARGCRVVGRFSFARGGALHTIGFTASIGNAGGGRFSLGQLCYDDTTSGMRDCTDR